MRYLLIFVLMSCACVVSATPIDPQRQTRRTSQNVFTRGMEPDEGGVKGTEHKGYPTKQEPSKQNVFPRKGEYFCGNKICKLEPRVPGDMPEGCNGMCQYPVKIIGPRPGDIDFDDN